VDRPLLHSAGSRLLQSPSEWERRNSYLSQTLADLADHYLNRATGRGLDIGCDDGSMADVIHARTELKMWGVDPRVGSEIKPYSQLGAVLVEGRAESLPFPDSHFDLALLANVYEHIPPDLRMTSLGEINRVLTKGGILMGQLPNPRFPIEQHSRLPFMGYLPAVVREKYWRLSPVTWKSRFWYPVTMKEFKRTAESAGFETVLIRKFTYPADVIPSSIRWLARLLENPIRAMSYAWQFVFRKN